MSFRYVQPTHHLQNNCLTQANFFIGKWDLPRRHFQIAVIQCTYQKRKWLEGKRMLLVFDFVFVVDFIFVVDFVFVSVFFPVFVLHQVKSEKF